MFDQELKAVEHCRDTVWGGPVSALCDRLEFSHLPFSSTAKQASAVAREEIDHLSSLPLAAIWLL